MGTTSLCFHSPNPCSMLLVQPRLVPDAVHWYSTWQWVEASFLAINVALRVHKIPTPLQEILLWLFYTNYMLQTLSFELRCQGKKKNKKKKTILKPTTFSNSSTNQHVL